jgi:hypothetical protein
LIESEFGWKTSAAEKVSFMAAELTCTFSIDKLYYALP